MRKPYDSFLIISVVLTVLYFMTEKRPSYVPVRDDQLNMLFFGGLYVALIFGILSLIYIYYKKSK
jgi:hypothetical protein